MGAAEALRYGRAKAFCRVALSQDGTPPGWVELFPRGPQVNAVDGREFMNVDPHAVVERFRRYGIAVPIDWEHASEVKAPNGDEAPAAGWITEMEVREGALWGKVEWTPRGAQSLTTREYRFISPAFTHDGDGNILEIVSAGLTNKPALTQLAQLASTWGGAYINDLPDSSFLFVEAGGQKDAQGKTEPRSLRHFPYKDAAGQVDLPHLRDAIGRIPQSNARGLDKQAMQMKAQRLLADAEHKGKAQARQEDMMDPKLLQVLGLDEKASAEQVIAAVEGLKAGQAKADEAIKAAQAETATARAELSKAAMPDLNKFVPRGDFDAACARADKAEKQIADDKAAAHKATVEAEVEAALKAGKVTPATKDFYLATCSTQEGLNKFRDFVKSAPVVAADSGLDKKPVPQADPNKPTDDQMAIARSMGISEEQIVAALKVQNR